VTGVNFCPSLLLAVSRALDLSGPLSGMLLFSAFFVGTNLYLLSLAIFGVLGNRRGFRIAARLSAVGVALWFIGQAGVLTITNCRSAPAVSLLDHTPAVIATCDSIACRPLREALQRSRSGTVAFVVSAAQLPRSGYVFVDPRWAECSGMDGAALKRPGVFAVRLPPAANASGYTEETAAHLVRYLSKCRFTFRKTRGEFLDLTGLGGRVPTDGAHLVNPGRL
jgi:hypothetical protein